MNKSYRIKINWNKLKFSWLKIWLNCLSRTCPHLRKLNNCRALKKVWYYAGVAWRRREVREGGGGSRGLCEGAECPRKRRSRDSPASEDSAPSDACLAIAAFAALPAPKNKVIVLFSIKIKLNVKKTIIFNRIKVLIEKLKTNVILNKTFSFVHYLGCLELVTFFFLN